MLLIVVDLNKHFNSIKENGINKFVQDHIKLNLNNELNKNKFESETLTKNKKIIFILNKKDLLNENQLDFIDKMLKTYQQESNIVINKIECKDNTSDLSELLNDLTISLSKL